ncbi:hypothetical protein CRG98_028333 [Punica granatum]|uniref:Uncharacterized protein n=1 Tax=Punica granatum TaxID=22663 RepID=A0A2I0J4W8_PUNGR|nr:hypothetical protein CRG98_028333 [Punica granatum]
MARLAKVVEGDGTSKKLDAPDGVLGTRYSSRLEREEESREKLKARLIACPISEVTRHLESRFCPIRMIGARLSVPVVQSLLHALYRPSRCAFRLMRHCWHGISYRRPLVGGDLGIRDWVLVLSECLEVFGNRCGFSLSETLPEDLSRDVHDH